MGFRGSFVTPYAVPCRVTRREKDVGDAEPRPGRARSNAKRCRERGWRVYAFYTGWRMAHGRFPPLPLVASTPHSAASAYGLSTRLPIYQQRSLPVIEEFNTGLPGSWYVCVCRRGYITDTFYICTGPCSEALARTGDIDFRSIAFRVV